jgi:tight adherence protein B
VKLRAYLVALGVLAVTATAATAAPPAIRVTNVDTSRLPLVSVTVHAPESLAAKGTPAFGLTENGQTISGLHTSDPNTGAAIDLLIDASRSMKGKPLAKAIAAARAFAAAKRPIDQFSVLSFGDEVSAGIPLTTDPTPVDAALREVEIAPKQGTALYDGLIDGVRALADAGVGRRVLVVLTDGDDTSSKATKAQVIAAAHEADVAIYAIALKSPTFKPLALTSITSSTGGGLFRANSGEIKSVYAEIGQALHSTYLLEYTSSLPATKIALRVTAPGATAATASFTADGATVVPAPKLNATVSKFSNNPAAGLILALAVGAVVLLVVLLMFRPSSAQQLNKRIEGYSQIAERRPDNDGEGKSKSPLFQQLLVSTERMLGNLKYWQRTGALLQRADMPMRAAELFYIQLGVGAGLGILSVLFTAPLPVSLIVFVLGLFVPHLYVARKAKKRLKAFEGQLPDTLVAVAASLRAGHSFAQAMSTIVKDGGEPAAKEFGRVEAETRLGRSTDDALQGMADRLASRNFEFVVLAVNIQRQVGGSLAEILDMVADTVREREQFVRKVGALTAMGRASAYVLVAMPFFIGIVLSLMNWKYMSPLFSSTPGQIMLVTGLVLIGLGSLILRKMVNFRF